MKIRYIMIVLLSINAALFLSACSKSPKARTATKIESAKIEKIAGTELNRVILSEKAAQRLDIQTAPVRMLDPTLAGDRRSGEKTLSPTDNPAQRLVVPYSAILYDLHGKTWVYTSPAPLTFVRHPITVDFIDGDRAVLIDGPPADSVVATVGVAELYGTDTGVGK